MSTLPLRSTTTFLHDDDINITTLNAEEDDDLSTLPFPLPLPRQAFTTPNFNPSTYLSTLHRHQTLEDLRRELATRSSDLEKELIDLINRDYADFVGLGSSLRGGDGKVNDLKLGVLGFAREVEGVQKRIATVAKEVDTRLKEKKAVSTKIKSGKRMVELDRRVGDMERLLMLTKEEKGREGEDMHNTALLLYDLDIGDSGSLTSLPRLKRLVEGWEYLGFLMERVERGHPFVKGLEGRVARIKKTLADDLAAGVKECREELREMDVHGDDGLDGETRGQKEGRLVEILGLWGRLGGEGEAVKALKGKGARRR